MHVIKTQKSSSIFREKFQISSKCELHCGKNFKNHSESIIAEKAEQPLQINDMCEINVELEGHGTHAYSTYFVNRRWIS